MAAKGLCLWVRAMETYGTVAKDVAPKRNKLKTAQENLSKKQTALAAAQTQLAEVLAKVQTLKVRPPRLWFCQSEHLLLSISSPLHTLVALPRLLSSSLHFLKGRVEL